MRAVASGQLLAATFTFRGGSARAIAWRLRDFSSAGGVDLSSSEIRVLVVDKHELVAETLVAALGDEPDLVLVGAASTADDARDRLRSLDIDVLVLDPHLVDGQSMELAKEAKRLRPGLGIVVLSSAHEPAGLAAAVAAGCDGYVPKSSRLSALIAAVRRVASGEMAIANAHLEQLAAYLAQRRSEPDKLTARELEILHLLAAGSSTEQIARRLVVSTHTVRNHIRSVLHKLGAHTRLEAVSVARHMGLLTDGG
jgi:DNA-binding NarL/FixJ family response regulator